MLLEQLRNHSLGTAHRSALLAVLACAAGCASAADLANMQRALEQRLITLEQRLHQQDERLRQMEEESKEAWSAALCSAEDREFFANVRAELAGQHKPRECSTEVALSCSAQQISPAIHERGGLGALFKSQHSRAAFYLPKDASAIPEYRLERLKKLGHLPLLPTTFFVFFAYPVPNEPHADVEARQRSETVSKYLVEHLRSGLKERLRRNGVTDESQLEQRVQDILKDRIWQLRLDTLLKKKDLDRLDAPMTKIGEPDDLRRGVWVFRVDC